MVIRKANKTELDTIYLMGYDVWGGDLPIDEYLTHCQNSDKYGSGCWYVLIIEGKPVSSLIVYSNKFGLSKGCLGIGSVATTPQARGKNYGSQLVLHVTQQLLNDVDSNTVFLHSDIGYMFYEKLGYKRINQTDCMFISGHQSDFDGSIPSYF